MSQNAGFDPRVLAEVVRSLDVGIYVWRLERPGDPQSFRLVVANPATTRYTDIPTQDVLGRRLQEAFPGLGASRVPALYAEVIRSGRPRDLGTLRYADPRVREREYRARAYPVGDDCVCVAFEEVKDAADAERARLLGERESLEEQLRQSQRLEAVGRLAGGIAHEFNNLLTAILGYAALLSRLPGLDDSARAHLDEIRDAGNRAAALTRQLLAFGRKQVLVPETLDLNLLVTNLNEMLHRLIGEDVEMSTLLHRGPAWVRVDRGQMEQVVVNLVVNARDAMPQGGRLQVAVESVELDAAELRNRPEVAAGRFAVLSVRDTGMGIDEDIRNHIFEPFFTTKELGKGTGLGLASVYGIVRQSGGFVSVESEPGVGTTFLVHLPLAQVEASSAATVGGTAEPGEGRETVLLVEDERVVRGMTREVLEASGYLVLEAEEGGQALRIAAEHAGPIHLLLTDVVMPVMSGTELARRLVERRPETAVLFASGYAEDAISGHGVLKPESAFIAKPFTPDALVSRIRELLDGRRPHRQGP